MSTMKLILTQEVTGLGTSGDTVEVKGGYGRNYLLPRGLAIKATRGAEKQIESLQRARWPGPRPASHRAAQQRQDHRPAHRHRAGAPGGRHPADRRGRPRLALG